MKPTRRAISLATEPERRAAELAALALTAWLDDPATGGVSSRLHVDLARPRRGIWLEQWSKLPGFVRYMGTGHYAHTLLPGWTYTKDELTTEMIPDLITLAQTGQRPTQETAHAE